MSNIQCWTVWDKAGIGGGYFPRILREKNGSNRRRARGFQPENRGSIPLGAPAFTRFPRAIRLLCRTGDQYGAKDASEVSSPHTGRPTRQPSARHGSIVWLCGSIPVGVGELDAQGIGWLPGGRGDAMPEQVTGFSTSPPSGTGCPAVKSYPLADISRTVSSCVSRSVRLLRRWRHCIVAYTSAAPKTTTANTLTT